MSSQYNCDYCNNLVYDEEIEGYVCDVDMDEDDYARLLSSSYKQCPYYQHSTVVPFAEPAFCEPLAVP